MSKEIKIEWTPELDDLVWVRYKNGHTHSAIAMEIGRGVSRGGIAGRIQRLRIVRDNYVPVKRGPLNHARAAAGTGRKPGMPRIPSPRSIDRFVPKIDFNLITEGTGEPCTLVDLVGCKWPIGEVEGHKGRHIFCNGPRTTDRPYCEIHSKAAGEVYKPWTAEEDSKLKAYWRGGDGRDYLAQVVHRTKSAITARARQLGLAVL